jgi:hypothetical protein
MRRVPHLAAPVRKNGKNISATFTNKSISHGGLTAFIARSIDPIRIRFAPFNQAQKTAANP